jgi:hypothetical protein
MSWTEIVILAMAPITGVVSWFASKKKHQAETDSIIIKNSGAVILQWKALADRYEKELSDIRKRVGEMEEKQELLEEELHQEKKLRKEVEDENITLIEKMKHLETKRV